MTTRGRPNGSTTRLPGKTTCLYIENTTREWLKNNRYTPTIALKYTPDWHDKMNQLAEEVSELRRSIERYEKDLLRLQSENIELLRLKNKFLDKIRRENRNGIQTTSTELY